MIHRTNSNSLSALFSNSGHMSKLWYVTSGSPKKNAFNTWAYSWDFCRWLPKWSRNWSRNILCLKVQMFYE